jgi:hypothetical protein
MMQTHLEIFDTCELKSTIVCRRIIQYCLQAENRTEKRSGKIMSIKEILQDVKDTIGV